MFDMLEDDLQIGYVPTIANSRSQSMKKLSKKQSKAPTPKPPEPQAQPQSKPKKISNDFDDLLDDPLDMLQKQLQGPNKNKSTVPDKNRSKISQFDDLLDQPKPRPLSLDQTKPVVKQQNLFKEFAKTNKGGLHISDQIVVDDQPSKNTGNLGLYGASSKLDQSPSIAPSRGMKPPLKKKQTTSSFSLNLAAQNISLNTNKYEDQEIIKPPPRGSRRSSAQNNEKDEITFKKMDSGFIEGGLKKQERNGSKQSLTLSFQQPKQQNKTSSFKSPPKLQNPTKTYGAMQNSRINGLTLPQENTFRPKLQPPPLQIHQLPQNKGLDYTIQQSITLMRDSPQPTLNQKALLQQHQKQIQHLKRTYQKQIDFLQDNLNKQITTNRQTRQKIMQDANKMIEEERSRSKKIHQEEMSRAEEIFGWEKKRLEDTYKGEIEGLRSSVQQLQKTQNMGVRLGGQSKDNFQYMETQIKNQKKLLEDRERILERREAQFQLRQSQIRKRRTAQQQRLRNQQKRLIELQSKLRREAKDMKRQLAEQKQQVAIEAAGLEVQLMKKQQRAEQDGRDNLQARTSLQNERLQMRHLSSQMASRYRVKMQELQRQKQRVKAIQTDLINKLRVVQLRMKQPQPTSHNKTMPPQHNNWVQQKSSEISIQRKRSQQKQRSQLNRTKERFGEVEQRARESMGGSGKVAKENKRFCLEDYMRSVQNYNKLTK